MWGVKEPECGGVCISSPGGGVGPRIVEMGWEVIEFATAVARGPPRSIWLVGMMGIVRGNDGGNF